MGPGLCSQNPESIENLSINALVMCIIASLPPPPTLRLMEGGDDPGKLLEQKSLLKWSEYSRLAWVFPLKHLLAILACFEAITGKSLCFRIERSDTCWLGKEQGIRYHCCLCCYLVRHGIDKLEGHST